MKNAYVLLPRKSPLPPFEKGGQGGFEKRGRGISRPAHEIPTGLGHRSARLVSLWNAATRRRMALKAATSRRTPHWVG